MSKTYRKTKKKTKKKTSLSSIKKHTPPPPVTILTRSKTSGARIRKLPTRNDEIWNDKLISPGDFMGSVLRDEDRMEIFDTKQKNVSIIEEMFRKGSACYRPHRELALSLCMHATFLSQQQANEFFLSLDPKTPYEYNNFVNSMEEYFKVSVPQGKLKKNVATRSVKRLEIEALHKVWNMVCEGTDEQFDLPMAKDKWMRNYENLRLPRKIKHLMVAQNMINRENFVYVSMSIRGKLSRVLLNTGERAFYF